MLYESVTMMCTRLFSTIIKQNTFASYHNKAKLICILVPNFCLASVYLIKQKTQISCLRILYILSASCNADMTQHQYLSSCNNYKHTI